MYERMEVSKRVYKGGAPSKIPTRSEANSDGRVRKLKGLEAASPNNPEKDLTSKRKTKMQAIRAMRPQE